jgi:hypothetical protein
MPSRPTANLVMPSLQQSSVSSERHSAPRSLSHPSSARQLDTFEALDNDFFLSTFLDPSPHEHEEVVAQSEDTASDITLDDIMQSVDRLTSTELESRGRRSSCRLLRFVIPISSIQ